MSAYSEWKYGLITDAEYNTICRREEADHCPWWEESNEEDDDDIDE